MIGIDAWVYGAVFLVATAVAAVFTPMFLRIALRRQILDRPVGHKTQDSPVPYLGGLAIAGTFGLTVFGLAVLRAPPEGIKELAVILGLGFVLALLGLIDDLRGLGPGVRVTFQVGAAVALFAAGLRVEIFPVTELNLFVTLIWVVGVTNAFNLLDNMDGLSAGVAAIAAFWFFVIASVNGQFLVAALSLALVGCALGFLRHNFHPASIYMGDSGSLFLGFLLAVIGIKLRFDAPTQITFFVPVLVLGVAIFDTTLVVISRIIYDRNPLSGGRDHVSHRLVRVGIPVPVSVSLIYAVAIGLGWLALIMSRVDVGTGFLLMGFVLTVASFLGILLGGVPVYETSRRRHLVITEAERPSQTVDESASESADMSG